MKIKNVIYVASEYWEALYHYGKLLDYSDFHKQIHWPELLSKDVIHVSSIVYAKNDAPPVLFSECVLWQALDQEE